MIKVWRQLANALRTGFRAARAAWRGEEDSGQLMAAEFTSPAEPASAQSPSPSPSPSAGPQIGEVVTARVFGKVREVQIVGRKGEFLAVTYEEREQAEGHAGQGGGVRSGFALIRPRDVQPRGSSRI